MQRHGSKRNRGNESVKLEHALLFIIFFHSTHIDAERPGCECASESFPDEGDKVEVISRALIQYDSPISATLCSQAGRAK